MTVRNGELASWLMGAGGNIAFGVTPTNITWLVKDIRVENRDASAQEIGVYVSRPSSGVTVVLFRKTMASNELGSVSCLVGMGTADELHLFSAAANAAVWVTGAALPGVGP